MGDKFKNVFMRAVSVDLYRQFRSVCVERDVLVGQAINEAIALWLAAAGHPARGERDADDQDKAL